MREKERRDNATISFSTHVLQSSTMIFMIESLLCFHFHILMGIFHYRTWLVYSNDGLPQNSLGLREQASWIHTHLVSFVELSYIYSSSASVAWQSLLTHMISINGHLHSPLIRVVDVRLSSPFFVLTTTTIYHHSAMSMACAHVLHKSWKKLKRVKKYETTARLVIGVVHDGSILCKENEAWTNYMIL